MASADFFEFRQDSLQSGSYYRTAFELMWRRGELTDVCLKAGDKTVCAHRIVLAAVFPFFKSIFQSNTPGENNREITFVHVDPDALECLVNFAYTGKITITSKKAQFLLTASDYLQVSDVQEACIEFLTKRFCPDNVLSLRLLGERLTSSCFVEKVDRYVSQNFDTLCETEEFSRLPFFLVKKLIFSADLQVNSVENVLEAITRWVKFEPIRRDGMHKELFSCVERRLLEIEQEFSLNGVKSLTLKVQQMLYADEQDAVDIYVVCFSTSSGRILQKWNSYAGSWKIVSKDSQYKSFTTVVSARGRVYAFTKDFLEVLDGRIWKTCGFLPWPVRSKSGSAISCGSYIYWFPNISYEVCSIWCFDTEVKKWTEKTSSVKMIGAGLASLWGYIYVLGGMSASVVTASAKKYDICWNEFEDIRPMLSRRSSPGCASLNEKIYVCGGYNGSFLLDTAEIYDPFSDQWTYIPSMKNQRSNFSLVPCGGLLYTIGSQTTENNSVEIYDPDERKWKYGQEFPGRYNCVRAVAMSA